MGVKTRRKQPKGADKDKKRGSPPDNAKGKRRSARTQKAQEDDTSKELPLKSISESKEKSNAKGARKENTRNNTTKRETKTEPMDIDKAEKPSNDAPSNDATTKDDAKKPPHKHHHHHHELNEETLKRIKAYLQSEKVNENLDEDAIAVKILRTDRATSERVKFLHDPFADSDEDNATDTTDSYQAAEEYTLALDFYKRAIAETQEEMPDVALDKRTLNWLRKALGLHRRNDLWETTGHEQPNAEETDESDGDEEGSQAGKAKNKRHVTRGMVRSTRIKRRAERKTKESMNLNALVSAVEDLEGEFGQFGENPASGVSDTINAIPQHLALATLIFVILSRSYSKRNAKGKRIVVARRIRPMKRAQLFAAGHPSKRKTRGKTPLEARESRGLRKTFSIVTLLPLSPSRRR